MPLRRVLAALALCLLPLPALAQATRDEPRLVFTVNGGWASGNDLWKVPAQPFIDGPLTDILALERTLTNTWTAGLGVTYFKGPNFGFTVDGTLIDLRQKDSCTLLSGSGSPVAPAVCDSIDGRSFSSMSAALSAGVIYRVAGRKAVSPYVRLMGGLFFGSLPSTLLTSEYDAGLGEPVFVIIYPNDDTNWIRGQVAAGAGVTVPLSKAWHARFEGRATTYGVPAIDGPTAVQGQEASTSTRWLTQWSLHIGMDLVLERKRGRRY
jgi:hypothetical protein